MKKTLTTLTLIFLFQSFIIAQYSNLEKKAIVPEETKIMKVLGISNEQIFALCKTDNIKHLSAFKKPDYALEGTLPLDIPIHKKDSCHLLNIHLYKDHFYALAYTYTKFKNVFSVYLYKISVEGVVIGNPLKVFASGTITPTNLEQKVDIEYSPDKSKALLYFLYYKKYEGVQKLEASFLDFESNELKVSKLNKAYKLLPQKSKKRMFNYQFQVQNDGSYFTMFDQVNINRNKVSGHKLYIHKYNTSSELIGQIRLGNQSRSYHSPRVLVQQDKIEVIGFYSDHPIGTRGIGMHGIFRAELDSKCSLINQTTSKFSKDDYESFFDLTLEREDTTIQYKIFTMYQSITDITKTNDGSYWLKTTTIRNERNTEFNRVYMNYGTILLKINKKLKITVTQPLNNTYSCATNCDHKLAPKKARTIFSTLECVHSKTQTADNYWLIDSNDRAIVLSNIHYKQFESEMSYMMYAMFLTMNFPSNMLPYVYFLNEGEKTKKRALYDEDKEGTTVDISSVYPLGNNKYIVLIDNAYSRSPKKKQRFGILEVK